jgi:hypothetical protein
MKIRSIRAKVALAAGALSSLIVLLFAVLSAWRFYHEQIDIFDENECTQFLPNNSRKHAVKFRAVNGLPFGSAVCRYRGGCGRLVDGGRLLIRLSVLPTRPRGWTRALCTNVCLNPKAPMKYRDSRGS